MRAFTSKIYKDSSLVCNFFEILYTMCHDYKIVYCNQPDTLIRR